MTSRAFLENMKDFFNSFCVKTTETKGAEYSGDDDKFANFKRIAKEMDSPLGLVWYVYFKKHLDSLNSFLKRWNKGEKITDIEKELSEPISGRIGDMIVYLFLIKGMIDERRQEEQGND
jgi:hypothetical protein